MTPPGDPLEPLRPYVKNALPPLATPYVAGIVGDHPSMYSHSPALWNAAFAALRLPATYVPFDVPPHLLETFLSACRGVPALLGLNVTVPHKGRAALLADRLDADADAAGAVNTLVRSAEGMLEGADTDGPAAVAVLQSDLDLGRLPGRTRVMLLGAGGAARALGVAAAARVSAVEIIVCARGHQRADDCAAAITRAGGLATVIPLADLPAALAGVEVIVNATPVGMSGPVQVRDAVTWLEPFSALAPVDPPIITADGASAHGAPAEWWARAWPSIAVNLEESLRRSLRLRADARMLDLVYSPADTVALKHLRWTGHRAAGGGGVLLRQAVEAFLVVCRPILGEGLPQARRREVTAAMARAAAT